MLKADYKSQPDQAKGHSELVSHFSHCCDQTLEKNT